MEALEHQNGCLKPDPLPDWYQWSSRITSRVMRSNFLAPVTRRAAAFWSNCSLSSSRLITLSDKNCRLHDLQVAMILKTLEFRIIDIVTYYTRLTAVHPGLGEPVPGTYKKLSYIFLNWNFKRKTLSVFHFNVIAHYLAMDLVLDRPFSKTLIVWW